MILSFALVAPAMAIPAWTLDLKSGDSADRASSNNTSSDKGASETARESGSDSTPAPAAEPAAQAHELLIKNATILTASHGTINNGSILVRNGKIAEVGTNVKASGPN